MSDQATFRVFDPKGEYVTTIPAISIKRKTDGWDAQGIKFRQLTPIFESETPNKSIKILSNPEEKKRRGRPPVIKKDSHKIGVAENWQAGRPTKTKEEDRFDEYLETPKTLEFGTTPINQGTPLSVSGTSTVTATQQESTISFEQAKQIIIATLEKEYQSLCKKAAEKQSAIQTIKSLLI